MFQLQQERLLHVRNEWWDDVEASGQLRDQLLQSHDRIAISLTISS